MGTLSNTTGHCDLVVDETSCGPMCQHPSCWASNQRREKGFPLKRERSPSPREDDYDLPSLKVYNMLEDYGDDRRDRFPASQSGRQTHERVRTSLPDLQKSSSQISMKRHVSIPALTSSSQEMAELQKKSRMKVVEVQEVFDVEDLNNQWDETFITRQYYVWVPNSKAPAKPKTLDPIKSTSGEKLTSAQTIAPKDMTEQLVPEEIEKQREEARVKKYSSAPPGINRGTVYSRGTTSRSARPYVDAESLQELLDLPRDVLLSVLEHMGDSDLASADKVQKVVKQVQPAPDYFSPRTTSAANSDLLKQKKVKLLGNKEKNQRKPDLLMTKPVFQLDREISAPERSIEIHTPVMEPVREVVKEKVLDPVSRPESSREEESTRELSKYKKPLPGIASAVSHSDGSTKLASISLGLPELPSGIRQTRPFNYKKQQFLDFSLGPVLTPPSTDRSSEAGGSDHGTTMRANIASASTRLHERDLYARFSRDGTPLTESSVPLQGISPSTSAKLPRTPMATPMTRSSPTKLSFQKEKSGGSQNIRSPPPSRDLSMSPVQKMIAPANSPNQSPGASPEPGSRGLVTIPELNDDGSVRQVPVSKLVSFVVKVPPPPPPCSLDEHHTYTVTLSTQDNAPSETHTVSKMDHNTNSNMREDAEVQVPQSPVSSHEEWPTVSEEAYDAKSRPASIGKRSTSDQLRQNSAERNSKTPASKGRSTVGSRESEKSSVVRIMMDEAVDPESPGPPPPSPEFKDKKRLAEARKAQEESQSMTPVYEENEAAVTNETKSEDYDPGVMTTVSQVTPQPKLGKREISVDTFVNVDIQADEIVPTQDEAGQGTSRSDDMSVGVSAAGNMTERTQTGGYQTDAEGQTLLISPVPEGREETQTGLSRETTGVRKEVEPESISGTSNIDAVNYDKQITNQSMTEGQNSALSDDELQQESVMIQGDLESENEEEQTQEYARDKSKENPEVAADVEESDADDRGTSSPSVNETSEHELNPVAKEETSDSLRLAIDTKEDADERPQKDVEEQPSNAQPDSEGAKGSAIDVNIPPPVSRTNTAIEMVKSVIENATAAVEEIISSEGSPDSQKESSPQ